MVPNVLFHSTYTGFVLVVSGCKWGGSNGTRPEWTGFDLHYMDKIAGRVDLLAGQLWDGAGQP